MKFRHHTLMGLLYSVLLAIPLVSVISKVIYVQNNKNAYQSFSDKLVDTTALLNVSNINTYYVQNQVVTWTYDENVTFSNQSSIFGFKDITLDINDLLGTSGVNYVGFRFYTSQFGLMKFVDSNGTEYNLLNPLTKFKTFTYVVDINTYNINSIYSYGSAYVTTYTTMSLDNVFEYAIDETIKDNNLGRIPFFDFVFDLCLDENTVNNRYVGYVNWYLNYVMVVSLAYILFLVLMWFVNYSRRLLERGMNYDF